MGVQYSTTVAYGIAVESDVYGDDPYVAEQWFTENGLDLLGFDTCGDFMSGEYVHLYYLKGTMTNADMYEAEGFVEFETPPLGFEEKVQLERMAALLGVPPSKIGWKLVFNVS